MAYSDYVQIYRVMESAGISDSDDRATQVAKIAAWINENFSDTVTASAVNDVRVLVMDNEVHAGFWWGQPETSNTSNPAASYPNNRGTAFYLDGSLHYMTSDDTYYYCNYSQSYPINNSHTIGSLGLFVCKATHGYVMDFIHLSDSSYGKQEVKFIVTDGKVKGNGDSSRCAIFGNAHGYSSQFNAWGSITKNYTTTGIYNTKQENYLRYYNTSAQITILTKYNPYGSPLICDGLYAVNGVIPTNETIFEIDGTKYLSLNYNDWGGSCHGLAFKLD